MNVVYILPVLLLMPLLLPLSLCLFLPCLALIFIIFLMRLSCLARRMQQGPSVAFFHPDCNGGGGGERVLWQCVLGLLDKWPSAVVHIYAREDENSSPTQILDNVEQRFGLTLPRENIRFIYLKSRILVEAKWYPVFTLLGQSIGSMLMGFEALWKFKPTYFIDSTGYAFSYLLAALVGCEVISYVHYPTISSDMLSKVANRESSYNNSALVATNPLLSSLKLLYYRLFAWSYAKMGALASLVFVNSSWTEDHINSIWGVPDRTVRLYPPCNTSTFLQIPLTPRSPTIVSVAQFRPEKNHRLQLEAFQKFSSQTKVQVKLILVGGVRNEGDRQRVVELQDLARELGIEELVEFEISIPYTRLHEILSSAKVGLHTMWNEHFGIGVVEFMAAGIIPIAHNSGGPKMDIVVPGAGFLATTADEYCDHMIRCFEVLGEEECQGIQEIGRSHVQDTFSDEAFREQFVRHCEMIAQMDLEGNFAEEEEQSESDDIEELKPESEEFTEL